MAKFDKKELAEACDGLTNAVFNQLCNENLPKKPEDFAKLFETQAEKAIEENNKFLPYAFAETLKKETEALAKTFPNNKQNTEIMKGNIEKVPMIKPCGECTHDSQTTQEKDDVNTFQNKIVYKPFDIVKVEKHGTWHYGMITETGGYDASVVWFEKQTDLHAAWWEKNELTVVNNAAAIIANEMAHPFGGNKEQGDLLFGTKNDTEQ